jgi:hypothetical protein
MIESSATEDDRKYHLSPGLPARLGILTISGRRSNILPIKYRTPKPKCRFDQGTASMRDLLVLNETDLGGLPIRIPVVLNLGPGPINRFEEAGAL